MKAYTNTRAVISAGGVVALMLFGWLLVREQPEEPITIGVLVPLSGVAAEVGVAIREGVLLGHEEANTRAGGGRAIELIVGDTKSDPEEAKRVFAEIEREHAPLLYISAYSGISAAVSPLAEEAGVPLLALYATDDRIPEGKEWTFRFYASPRDEAAPVVRLAERLGTESIGVLYLDDAFGTAVFEGLRAALANTSVHVAGTSFALDATEYDEQLHALAHHDALYLVAFATMYEDILKAVRASGYAGAVVSSSDAADPSVFSLPEAEGSYIAAPGIYNDGFVFANELRERYEREYEKALTVPVANGYDAMKIIRGLLEGEELSRDGVRAALDKGFNYFGAFGDIHVLPESHDIRFSLYPTRVEDGALNYLR